MNDLKGLINQLEQKVDNLINMVNLLTNKDEITANQLEAVAAKIINDIQKEIHECPCNKEILEHIKNVSSTSLSSKPGKYSGLSRYSPPSFGPFGNQNLKNDVDASKALPFKLKEK